jgi:transcriptional regulator with XRE-family HTH domain
MPATKKSSPVELSTTDPINRHIGQRLRALRNGRGLSLEALSAASGVSRSMLSQIEREQANPTLAITLRIGQAFGMSIGEFVGEPGASSSVVVIRGEDRAYHYRSDSQCRIRTLSPLNLEKDVEFYEVRLAPQGALRSGAHFSGTREFVTVVTGQIEVQSGDDVERLAPGDSATYRADVAHALINVGATEAVAHLVDIFR